MTTLLRQQYFLMKHLNLHYQLCHFFQDTLGGQNKNGQDSTHSPILVCFSVNM